MCIYLFVILIPRQSSRPWRDPTAGMLARVFAPPAMIPPRIPCPPLDWGWEPTRTILGRLSIIQALHHAHPRPVSNSSTRATLTLSHVLTASLLALSAPPRRQARVGRHRWRFPPEGAGAPLTTRVARLSGRIVAPGTFARLPPRSMFAPMLPRLRVAPCRFDTTPANPGQPDPQQDFQCMPRTRRCTGSCAPPYAVALCQLSRWQAGWRACVRHLAPPPPACLPAGSCDPRVVPKQRRDPDWKLGEHAA